MGGIKRGLIRFLLVLGILGMASPVLAQINQNDLLNPPVVYTSFITPRVAQVGLPSTFYYQRSTVARSGAGYALGSPALSIGMGTANYTLWISNTFQVQKNIIASYATINATLSTFSTSGSKTVDLSFATANAYIVTLNVRAANVDVTFNITTPSTWAAGALARHLKIYLKYEGSTAPRRVAVVTPGFRLKWPSGDYPIFTKTLGKMDIISLYWTGPDWPVNTITQTLLIGEFYGTVSFNHAY